jgi:hypothetical protein
MLNPLVTELLPIISSILSAGVALLVKKVGGQVTEVKVLVNGAKEKLEKELAEAKATIAAANATIERLLGRAP